MITLIGMGSGTPESLTAQGLAALQNAGLILGAKRLLEQLPQGCTEHRKALYQPEDVLAALAADPEVDAALVYSGEHRVLTPVRPSCCRCCGPLASPAGSAGPFQRSAAWPLPWAAPGRSGSWSRPTAVACDPVAECLTAGESLCFS